MREEPSKMLLSSFSVVHLPVGVQPGPKNRLLPQRDSLREQTFICSWLPIGNRFWGTDRDLRLLLSALGPTLLGLLQNGAVPVCAASAPVSSCTHWPCCIRKAVFPSCLLSPLAFTLCTPPLLQGSLGGMIRWRHAI